MTRTELKAQLTSQSIGFVEIDPVTPPRNVPDRASSCLEFLGYVVWYEGEGPVCTTGRLSRTRRVA